MSELALVDTGSEIKVRREITDDTVNDYIFYLVIAPTSGNSLSKFFGPYTILATTYCSSSDVTGNLAYPAMNFEAGSASGFENVQDQNFMTALSSCLL